MYTHGDATALKQKNRARRVKKREEKGWKVIVQGKRGGEVGRSMLEGSRATLGQGVSVECHHSLLFCYSCYSSIDNLLK